MLITNKNNLLKTSSKDNSELTKLIKGVIYSKPLYKIQIICEKFIDATQLKLVRLDPFLSTKGFPVESIKINDLKTLENLKQSNKYLNNLVKKDIFPRGIKPMTGLMVEDHKIKYRSELSGKNKYYSLGHAFDLNIINRPNQYPYYINLVLKTSMDYKNWELFNIFLYHGFYDFTNIYTTSDFVQSFRAYDSNYWVDSRIRVIIFKFDYADIINGYLPIPFQFNDEIIDSWLEQPQNYGNKNAIKIKKSLVISKIYPTAKD